MKKIESQILYHLKKDKGSYFSFGIIVLFTAFMLNLALVLAFQVDKAYDEKFEDLHAATINICIPKSQNTEQLTDHLKGIQSVAEVEAREAVFLEAVVKEFKGTDFSMNTVFYNIDEARSINRLEIKEDAKISKQIDSKKEEDGTSEQFIYLPLYVARFGEFETGNEIIYEINGESYNFTVAGILEEMQYGNYGKGLMGAYLPEETYKAFYDKLQEKAVMEYSLVTEKDADLDQVKNEINSLLNEQGIMMLSNNDSISTKDTRTMVCNLLILILAAFAVVILLVSVFLCKFRISNSMEEEMVNMGVLKAIGYTGNMMIGSIVIPYMIVTVLAALSGVLASYGILPILSQVLTLQSGFSFTLSFDARSLICVILILVFIVLVFTYGAARHIRKIQPIHAIRGNGGGKQTKKNYFPLEETAGKTTVLLILKQMCACGKQNVLLFLVSFVLTVLVAFASTMFYNVIMEPDNFMSTLSEETPDVIFNPKEDKQESLMDTLQGEERVRKALPYTTGNVKIGDASVTVFACKDFEKVSNDLCYLGENPDRGNEIALGSTFEENYKIGDTIEIKNENISCEYEITGFIQSVNYQGNVCEFTLEGYGRLSSAASVSSVYVYVQEGTDVEDFLEGFDAEHGDLIESGINSQKMKETSQEMFSGITVVLIAAIFILTMLIVLFVLYIVIRSLIVQRKQELGIYKAMGYANGQLMMQMAGSFLPVSICAVLLSSVLGLVYMPYLNQFIFQTVGAMKNNMEVSLPFLMIFALLQIVINFVISISLSMPIRKISAYSLIKE